MRIFITGASGFIGKHLLEELSGASDELLLLARCQKDYELLKKYKAKLVDGGLKDLSEISRGILNFNPQVCIHLAWSSIPDYSFQACKLNLDNSISLISFILNETECKKIIISGSCLEYGVAKGKCKESDNIIINSFFAWAKYSLYIYADFLCKKLNKDLLWFRKFYVYGNNQREEALIPSIVRAFKSRTAPDIKNPFNANDFIHVKDVARAVKIAARRNIEPGIYNLGSGKSSRVIDICAMIEKLICGNSCFSDKIRFSSKPAEPVNFWADISKAKKSLSWQPRIPIEDGIMEYWKEEANV